MRHVFTLMAVSALVVFWPCSAKADITVSAFESGGDVVFTGIGFANLTDLTFAFTSGVLPAGMVPVQGELTMGNGQYDFYSPMNDFPSNFGTSLAVAADSSSGDLFGFGQGFVVVPVGYTSGALAGTMTFNGHTFASLGVTPGTYVSNWGSGANADSFTLNIGVPEPGSALLCAVGGILCLIQRRRRSRSIA